MQGEGQAVAPESLIQSKIGLLERTIQELETGIQETVQRFTLVTTPMEKVLNNREDAQGARAPQPQKSDLSNVLDMFQGRLQNAVNELKHLRDCCEL
jgi:hypothetical protein